MTRATHSTAPFISDYDLHLMREGKHYRVYQKLGAHLHNVGGASGVHFAVQAPNAERVSVIGDFNAWNAETHPLRVVSAPDAAPLSNVVFHSSPDGQGA